MRNVWCIILCMVYSFALGSVLSGHCAETGRTTTTASPNVASNRDSKIATTEKTLIAGESKLGRIREGSKLVDQVGEFQKSGDHINFFAKEPHGALRVLENLQLERVARAIDDNTSKRIWSVTGVITEFRGENYLLLTRAILKAQPKTSPPVEQRKTETADKKED